MDTDECECNVRTLSLYTPIDGSLVRHSLLITEVRPLPLPLQLALPLSLWLCIEVGEIFCVSKVRWWW